MIGEIGLPVLQFSACWFVLCCAVLLALLCSLYYECTRGVVFTNCWRCLAKHLEVRVLPNLLLFPWLELRRRSLFRRRRARGLPVRVLLCVCCVRTARK